MSASSPAGEHPSEDGWIWAQQDGGPWLHEPTALRMREAIARHEHEQHRPDALGDVVPLLLAAPCPHHGCTHDRGSHLNGTGRCGWCACPSFAGEQIPFAVLDGAA